jgi:hypothetical protein
VVEVTGRGRRVRSVQTVGRRARARGSWTDTSGPSRNWRVRSRTQKTARVSVLSGRGGASGHVRLDASDRTGSSLDSDRTSGAARPVKWCSASGWHRLVRLGGVTRSERGGASGHVRPDASDHARTSLDSDRTSDAARPVKPWSASGHPDWCVRSVRFSLRRPVTASCIPLRYK